MADKNVSMTLTVDAKQVDAATAAQKKLAEATQKTADAQKKLNDQTKAAQSIFDQKYRQQNQTIAMSSPATAGQAGVAARGGVGPASGGFVGGSGGVSGRPGGPGGGGGGREFQAGGFASVLGIGAAFSGFNRAIDFTRQNADNPRNLTVGNFINETVRGIPLVGGLAGMLEDTIGDEVGYSNRGTRRRVGQAVEFASQQGERERQIAALRGDTTAQQRDLNRQAMDARTDANAATRFRETVQGTNASFFNTKNEFGVSNEQTGELRLEKMRAESNLFGAQQLGASSAAEAAAAARRVAEAKEAVRLAAGQAAASGTAAERALTAQEQGKKFFAFGDNQRLGNAVEETAARAAADREKLQTRQVELVREENELKKQQIVASEDLKRVAEERRKVAESQIAIDRNDLAILKEKQSALKAGAIQGVGMDEGTKMALLDATKKLKAGGIGDLTDEERSLVQGSALTQNLYQKEAEKFGRNDPLTQQIAQAAGLGTLQQADTDIEALTNKIREESAQANEAFRKEVSDAVATSVKELGETLTQILRDTTQAINTAASNARDRAAAQSPSG